LADDVKLADDVTAKRTRSSRLPWSSVPSVQMKNPALASGWLRWIQSWADCSPKAALEGAIL